jgi:class 3 adenylate cyclase
LTVRDLEYATAGDGTQVAFRVHSSGAGEPILYLPGLLYSIESIFEDPPYAQLINALGELRPLVLVERRGVGASDPLDPSRDVWEQWSLDVVAVLDQLDIERACLIGSIYGADIALQTASRFPSRVASVVAVHPLSHLEGFNDDDTRERMSEVVGRAPDAGYRELALAIPSRVHDQGLVDWFVRVGRLGASPKAALEFWSSIMRPNDLRARLGGIEAPVMLIQRRDYTGGLPEIVEAQREAAARIPKGHLVVLEGADLVVNAGDIDALVFEVAEFLAVGRGVSAPTRPLATLLFTDLVGSTEAVRRRGDNDWRSVLDQHDRLIDRTVRRHGGTMVKATGDGALITFISPSRALRSAVALREQLASLQLQVRVGLHLGEIEGRRDDVAGIAVHLAARVMSMATAGQILTTAALPLATMGGGFTFESRGHHQMKGFAQPFEIYELLTTDLRAQRSDHGLA